jgi:hypothetical protein
VLGYIELRSPSITKAETRDSLVEKTLHIRRFADVDVDRCDRAGNERDFTYQIRWAFIYRQKN